MNTIEKLQELNVRLTSLLNYTDGHGMATWWQAVFNVIDDLKATATPEGVDNV